MNPLPERNVEHLVSNSERSLEALLPAMAAADYPNQPWFALTYAPTLMAGPDGIYGVSYDVFTRPTEDPLPNGWEAHRCKWF